MSFYLTTPIYYVNSTPHIGHAYTTIAADILVRHHRQRGEETYFLTGVDEHADKVARVAAEQGLTPKEYVDQIVVAWQELPARVNASIDYFIRTTDEGHKRFVQDFLQRIYDNGDVYQDVYAGLYCVGCEAFKNEDELVDGKCPDHGIAPEWIEEKNWFFRLSAYQEKLLQLYDERPDFVLPGFRANEAKSFIAGGLRDFSISRATQTWGIPVPWDPDQVAYVWADALVNYLSALSYAAGRRPAPVLARAAPAGKDILRFHCVYWPALLLSAGYEVPKQLFVHGYLNLDDRKISKSLGNVLDPLDLIDDVRRRSGPLLGGSRRPVRPGRQRHARQLPRALRARARQRPRQPALAHDGDDRPLPRRRAAAARPTTRASSRPPRGRCRKTSRAALDRFDITGALETIWDYVRRLNRYVEQNKPWELAKDPSARHDLDRALYELADGLRIAAVALSAVPARHVGANPGGARPAGRRRLGAGGVRTHRAGVGDRGGAAALPAHRRADRDRARDRHPRAPRRARGAGRGRRASTGGGRDARDHDRDRDRVLPRGARDRRGERRRLRGARDRPAPGGRRRGGPRRRAARAARPARRRSRSARPGLDYHYGAETKDEQRRLFEAQLALARRAPAPGRDPHARGERRHRSDPRAGTTARSSCTASPSRACSPRRSSAASTSPSPAT